MSLLNNGLIAVLITCHNRKDKTLECLEFLFQATLPQGLSIEIFLVDDGSVDGTSDLVNQKFPKVKIIKGNGSLYWNQGMRLAWKTALQEKKFDYYVWLNDDTIIDNDAFKQLFNRLIESGQTSIIVGACRDKLGENKFSYGLKNNKKTILPNERLVRGNIMNGNLVLIPSKICNKIGILSQNYTHAYGDHDYGLRAIENGFYIYTTKKFIATCSLHEKPPAWCDPNVNLIDRLKSFKSPLGLNIREYLYYVKRFERDNIYLAAIKALLKCLHPRIYYRISKKKG